MNNKISFSYIFDDEMERVCKCFSNFYLLTEITFSTFISNAKLIQGENLDEEGTIMEFSFKNYYEIKMKVENVKNRPLYKSYIHKAISINKISLNFSIIFQFYYNSCEKKTVFFYDFLFDDDFFEPLIKDEVTKEEKEQMCNNVVQYLRTNKDINLTKGSLINDSIDNVWNFIKSGKNINENILNKIKFKTEFNGNFESLDTFINVYATDKNSFNNNTLIACLFVNKIFMNEDKIEVVLKCSKSNMLLPNLAVIFSLYKTAENKCFLNLLIYPYEHLSADTCNLFSKCLKKYLSIIKEQFKKKK